MINNQIITALLCVGISNVTYADDTIKHEEERGVTTLENVVVTGEKQDRSLKNTLSSVSVIEEEELRSTQNHNLRETISDVPNIITTTGVVPNIRGVNGNGGAGGFNSITGGAKPRVSILLDGVTEPFVADFTGDSGLWDIEQIEVYRGPQSTNNGRNSIGGAIYIKTKDPSFDTEGAIRLGYRNQEDYLDTSLMMSGPLIEDKLAYRISAQFLNAQTITNDEEYDSNPADYDLNEIQTDRLRAKLLWVLSDDLDALFTYSGNREQGDTGRVYYEAEDLSEYNRLYFRDMDTESDTTSLKLGYQINETSSVDVLVSTTDYQFGFEGYEPDPADEQTLVFDENNTFIDTKFNFGEGNNMVNGYIGVAFFEREQDIESSGAFIYNGDDSSDSTAVYGEVNYALNDRLVLIGGLRVERESQLRDFTYGAIAATLDESKTFTLPKLAFKYDLSKETTLGFSARKGYNSAGGALNFAAQEYYYYDEETVDTFEFSVRSSLGDGSVNLRANVFYNEYDGYQALSSTRFIVNMNEVVTYGAEVEATASVSTDLELTAGFGLLHTEIKDASDDYADATGNELSTAPESTAKIGATYYLGEDWSVGASVQYIGSYYGDIENTEERKISSYSLAKLSANYEAGDWFVSAYINNLTDKEAYRVEEPVSGRYPTGYVDVIDPRNVGISATYSF